jgi:translation initiation factor IF-3
MPTPQALSMAQERGYDLVEVAPMASPPVVRFLDFGQYKYELTKREKEAKRRQRSVTFKEVRLKPKIGQGDFDTKVRRAIEFLEDGDRIKVAVQFRGRELTHPEIGRNLLTRFTEQIKDHGLVERQPLLEGKSMHVTVASTHKPKTQEASTPAVRPSRPANGEAPATEPAAAQAQATEPAAAQAPATEPAAAEKPAATAAEKPPAEPTPRPAANGAVPAQKAAAPSPKPTAQEPQPVAAQQRQPAARATSAGKPAAQSRRAQAPAREDSPPRAASTGE